MERHQWRAIWQQVAHRFARRDSPEDPLEHVNLAGLLPSIVVAHEQRVEPALHGAVVEQSLAKRPRVEPSQSRNDLSQEPFMQGAARSVMAARLNVILNHQTLDWDLPSFVRPIQGSGPLGLQGSGTP